MRYGAYLGLLTTDSSKPRVGRGPMKYPNSLVPIFGPDVALVPRYGHVHMF